MKKILFFIFSFISLPIYSLFGLTQAPKKPDTDVKVVFKSEETAPFITNLDYYDGAKFSVELLQNLAEQQEHRKLTMEEMSLALRVISFLFLQETEDYNKCLEISFKNGKKLYLPYSYQLFAILMQNNDSSNDSQKEEQNLNEKA